MNPEKSGRNSAEVPRLRAGITLVPRGESGGGIIVADREAGRHFLVDEIEGRLLALLDGCHTLPDLHQCLAAEFPQAEVDAETIARFTARLAKLGLLEGSVSSAPRRAARSNSPLYFLIPLGNPERFFRGVVHCCPFLFTRAFWTAAAGLMLVALWTGIGSWSELRHDGFRFHSLSGLLLIWGSLFFIGAIHEMGHGLTSTYYGAPATRWGLLFMYLMPCAFCDVSAAWTLPKKSQRLAVGAAGLAFQWVAGAVAILIWRVVEPGTVPARALATVAGTCGLASLLNLWPFMRLDGYYILSDALEMPNLRTRSLERLKAQLGAFLLGRRAPETAINPREERILTFYGAGVALWSGVMLWIMAHRLSHLFVGAWGGLAAMSVAVVLFVGRGGALTGWTPPRWWPWREQLQAAEGEKRRRAALPPLALGAGLLLVFGQWELNVSSPCRLEAMRRAPIRARVGGALADFRYREGDRVRRGAILGTLETFDLSQQLAELETRRSILVVEHQALETRLPSMAAATDQLEAEQRAGVERARTDLSEMAEELPQRAREASGKTAQAAAEEKRATEDVRVARAAVEAQVRATTRLREDWRHAMAGDYPPALAALDERVRKCRADRQLAERERKRTSQLVEEGAVAAQTLDRADAAVEARSREERASRGDLKAGLKELREAVEDAQAELDRRRAVLAAAMAQADVARAAQETVRRAEQRVLAQCRPEQLTAARRQLEAKDSALNTAFTRRGEVGARRLDLVAKRLEAERLDRQIAVLRRRLKNSALIAPIDGVITTPRVEERVGRHFNAGETVCAVEKPKVMAVSIFVPEKEIGDVRVGAPVFLKVASYPERTFAGKVMKIAPVAQRRGEDVACEVRIHVPNARGDLRAGMTGWAKIACGRRPLGILLTRRLSHYLRTEAWSWFSARPRRE